MRVEPRLDEVVNGKRGIRAGIKVCLERECLVSAVSLIFAGIDALSALTRPIDQNFTGSSVFKDWCDRFLKPEKFLGCSSGELYSARCGVLHLYSSESSLAASGKSKRLIYEWRSGPAADAAQPLPENALVIELEALHQAFETAVREFIIASEVDPEARPRVQHHLRSMLCYEPFPTIAGVVAA